MTLHSSGVVRTGSAALMALAVGSALFWGCGPQYPDSVDGSFDFQKHAFTFNNFDDALSSGKMTAALAARMFGDEAVCLKGVGGSCEPRPSAALWVEEVNAQTAFGHSEGMAVLSLLMSMGKVAPADFGADSAAGLTLDNAALRAELTYWAATQKILSTHGRDRKLTAKETLPFLATALVDKNEGWRLLLAVRDAGGFHAGHAVVPFGYFRGSEKGQFFIRIYDPNFPAQERRIELNVETNSWKYEGSPNPEQPRSYEGTTANGNLLYFSPVTARIGTFTAPFVDGFSASASGPVFAEGGGAEVGFKNGAPVENGGTLLPGAADCFCKAPTGITNVMISGNGPKTISVGADAGTLYAMSSSVAAKVEPKGAAAITVDPGTKSVTYNSTSETGTTLTTTTKNADGSETTVSVTLDRAANGVTIDASDPSNVKVSADVKSSPPTTVRVVTTVTLPSGASTTTVASGTTKGGNDVDFTVNATAGTTSVNTNVNYAVCLNKKKDPMEAALDCGSFCNVQEEKAGDGRCMPGSVCSTNDDCELAFDYATRGIVTIAGAGECLKGVCAASTCLDGRQNGYEFAVDCGGGCGCKANQPCKDDRNCNEGLSCTGATGGLANGTCLALAPHSLTIHGVDPAIPITLLYRWDDDTSPFLQRHLIAPGTGPFNQTFNAARRLEVKFAPGFQNPYDCRFDSADSQGNWLWDSATAPAANTNTLRCVKKVGKVSLTTNGTGCPNYVDYRSDAGLTASMYFPKGPSLTLTSQNPGITVTNWNSSSVIRSLPLQTGTVAVSGAYDGGVAYSLSLDAPIEADAYYPPYTDPKLQAYVRTLPKPGRYRFGCSLTSPSTGAWADNVIAQLACYCGLVVDGGIIGGPDAGTGGTDAGTGGTDAGSGGTDAGTGGTDAGMGGTDAGGGGTDAGGGGTCTVDSDCGPSADCYCGDNSGNCTGNIGSCGAGKLFASTPTTNGVTASGAFTVPASCTQVRVDAWGAAGGAGQQDMMGFPVPHPGGAGGYVTGVLSVTPGQTLTVWVGNAGDLASSFTANEGVGSYAGTVTNGGKADGMSSPGVGGSGGGLTSLKHAQSSGTTIALVTVPAGGGAGELQPGEPAGGTGAGTHTMRSGEDAASASSSGGGGAGENGGSAGLAGLPGNGGAFGTLPAGLTSTPGQVGGAPGGTTVADYSTACGDTAGKGAASGPAGNGCVVLRCLP